MESIIALDVGTTAVKAALFSGKRLAMKGLVIREYTLLTPSHGMIEIDPEEYWNNAVSAIRQLMSQTCADYKSITAIVCTTQGETLIPVDKNANALDHAIVWLDSRAKTESDYIKKMYSKEQFFDITGIPEVTAYCPVAKLLWLKNNKPQVYENAYKIVLLEDYLISRMTGNFVSNPALMCSTGYFNIKSEAIWDDILEKCGIDKAKIPEVLPCGTKAGALKPEVAKCLGLPAYVTVATGAMDQVAAAVAVGNTHSGIVSEMTGTCLVVAATCKSSFGERWRPFYVYCHALKGKHLAICCSQTAGIIYKWFRDEFCGDLLQKGKNGFVQMDRLAASEPPLSNGVILFPHFTGMQVPISDPFVRGVFFGVGLNTGRASFLRAIMEGVGYMLQENIELLQQLGISVEKIFSSGGGAKSTLWNQIKADITGIQVFTLDSSEETALLGAAILGSVACKIHPDIETALAAIHLEQKSYNPDEERVRLYKNGYKRYRMMYERFSDIFHTDEIAYEYER